MYTISDYLKQLENDLRAGNATEHTHRPALKSLIESLEAGITATNEPRRVACGAPDFVISRQDLIVGYMETKDVNLSLDQVERSEQLKRYLRSLNNLVLTDYLEFRWYTDGKMRGKARLAEVQAGGKLKKLNRGTADVENLLKDFLAHTPQAITSPEELASRLARLAHIIRDIIVQAFEQGHETPLLAGVRSAFAQILIAGLDQPHRIPEFADMFAQTLAYGLFSARMMDTSPGFSLNEAQRLIPQTNPFLRDFFYQITGPQLPNEPYASFVGDIVDVLAHTDINAVLADFGKRTRQDDPVVHFYETFLAAYDPKLRESRGVYYTPQPAVSYIVRSIDLLLKRFRLTGGLADATMVAIPDPTPGAKKKDKIQRHKVLLLDPATGTATFPYAVIDHIRQGFMQSNNAGMWAGYVREHLLPRLFGFELLMAPYVVAHFKLALQLAARDLPEDQRKVWAYEFSDKERVQIYLTNTLEEPHQFTGLPLFTQFLADETEKANTIKQDLPIMVIFGNPPYSGHSANKIEWLDRLLKGKLPDGRSTANYYEVDGEPLGEKNPKWLQDDYVKFIRWAQWRIERSGAGIIAFITNHGYLDNPTFRGMRQALLSDFDDIYILNLHGNAKKKEVAPDGSKDENVFDIQQGVAISIFVKEPPDIYDFRVMDSPDSEHMSNVYYADLWGDRDSKYRALQIDDVTTTNWQVLHPRKPFYLFVPQDTKLLPEYEKGWLVTDIFPVYASTVTTARNDFSMAYVPDDLQTRISDLVDTTLSDQEIRDRYQLKDVSYWNLKEARAELRTIQVIDDYIKPYCYRPFDFRYVYYHGAVCERLRADVMQHMKSNNLAFLTHRPQSPGDFTFAYCTRMIGDQCVAANKSAGGGNSFQFPLYTFMSENNEQQSPLFSASPWPRDAKGRVPNLKHEFMVEMESKLGLSFSVSSQVGDDEFTPEDIFGYAYAVFHSPTYRKRYAEYLKADFPRLPLTSDKDLFRKLVAYGKQLVGLHLLESSNVGQFITSFPVTGDKRVERGYPKYTEANQRVEINPTQFLDGVPPDVWAFQVGGYQVLDKWLKDRQGRLLSHADLTHYQKIIVALKETIRIMEEIDTVIPGWPMV